MATTLAFTVKRSAPELVAPSRATPRELRPLSDIDDQDGLRFYRSGLHFFRGRGGGGADPAAVVRRGLADALVHYYPVAGRIREVEAPARKLVVDCTGDGVVFVEADADVSLSDFGDVLCPPFPCYQELLCEPDGNCAAVVGRPLLFIQVTRLRCGGFVFGLQICHNIADAAGTVQLLRAIGEMSRGMPAPTVPPVWARELLMARSPPVVTHRHPEYDETAAGGNHDVLAHHEPLVQRAFFFGPKEMSALRELAAPAGAAAGKRISRFDMLAAFLWQRRAAALEYDDDDEVRVMFVVNARGRSPPLPAGFYGNAFAFAVAACTAGRLRDSPLADVVGMVAGAKARATSEGNLQSVADLMAQRGRPRFGRAARAYLVSDVTRAGFEGVDFGWGEGAYGGPAAATLATFHLTVKDASGEEVIAVPMCLPAPAMERLELDVQMSLNH
ncbi:benzyl alcohol O-benzoyltransferase-like [Oryza glaberrima]|uniref:Uncharacterized protein n=2 Tax=Oryza TaxID=4527 RepID=A0A0D3GS80_9ORYZ|nr:benzyl alcohol O-benzoyltransferase-like [Oryza glaberrima]